MPKTSEIEKGFGRYTRMTILAQAGGGSDLYHRAVRMRWRAFLALLAAGFLAINALFGLLYMLGSNTIAGAAPDSFSDHFFFSVQTLATIGYGAMSPHTLYGHLLVTVEAMVGVIAIGIVAALAFARFSLPRARVRFSDVAVISNFEGVPTLMIRASNERHNSILAARAQVSLLRQELTREGINIRRFYDLPLARSETQIFSLSWLIMHPITATSPLYEISEERLQAAEFALLVSITGIDENLSQTLHSRHSYFNTEVRLNYRFRDMLEVLESGERRLDLRRISDIEPAAPAP